LPVMAREKQKRLKIICRFIKWFLVD